MHFTVYTATDEAIGRIIMLCEAGALLRGERIPYTQVIRALYRPADYMRPWIIRYVLPHPELRKRLRTIRKHLLKPVLPKKQSRVEVKHAQMARQIERDDLQKLGLYRVR